jgi:hypothetical protein
MKKIIITEEQKETLVDKLLYMIDLHGFDVAVSTVGSVKNLVKVIGKDNFETVLIEHKFDPNEIQLVTSIYDVSDSFYMFGGVVRQKLMKYLNDFGPMFLLKIGGNRFLYQNQGNDEYFASDYSGYTQMDEVLNYAGLTKLKIKDVITIFDDKINEQY